MRGVDAGGTVFLDRDGVLNEALVRAGRPYAPRTGAEFRLLDEARPQTERLARAGWRLVVVTNQPDVGNGLVSRAVVEEMNETIRRTLPVLDVLTCWHGQAEGCDCRKPKPGLLHAAAERFGLALDAAVMVGDRWSDVAAGAAAGCRTVLIDRGYSEKVTCPPDVAVSSLATAVDWILDTARGAGGEAAA